MTILVPITIEFERIGRNRNAPAFTYDLDPTDPRSFDDLVDGLYRHVGKFLSSREYVVDVTYDPDTDTGAVTIDGGRFGTGTVRSTTLAS